MSNLAWMHERGRGTRLDRTAARQWYAKAAELGDGFAKEWLAKLVSDEKAHNRRGQQ